MNIKEYAFFDRPQWVEKTSVTPLAIQAYVLLCFECEWQVCAAQGVSTAFTNNTPWPNLNNHRLIANLVPKFSQAARLR